MKKTRLIILMMSILAVFIVSSGAVATVVAQVWGFLYYAPPDASQFVYKVPALDLGTLDLWSVSYSGTGVLSTTISDATLTGNFPAISDYPGVGHIWSFDYSVDNATWANIGYAAHTVTAPAGANSSAGGTDGVPTVVYARYLRMGYDWTLSSALIDNEASVGGTGSMVATVVPEPGAFLVCGSGLIGLIGFGIRRQK